MKKTEMVIDEIKKSADNIKNITDILYAISDLIQDTESIKTIANAINELTKTDLNKKDKNYAE